MTNQDVVEKVSGQVVGTKKSTLSKALETFCLALTFVAMAAYAEIYGPTLIDLKIKLDTDYEEVAVAVSGRSVGSFPGSIMAGFLVDKLSGHCHLLIAVGLNIAAIATVAIPWSPSLTCLWCFCFIGGMVEALINITSTRILYKIWQEKSAPFLMFVHLGYGIGSFCVPLFSNPFLAGIESMRPSNNETSKNNTLVLNGSFSTYDNLSLETKLDSILISESRIEYAYAVSACFAVVVSVAFYCFQFRESKLKSKETTDLCTKQTDSNTFTKPKKSDSWSIKDIINPAGFANGRFCYKSSILFLVVLYFGNNAGADKMIGNFIRSFAIDQYGLSSSSASALNTSYWVTFSAGRFVFIFLARCISVRALIIIETTGMAVSAGLLYIFAQNCSVLFWILIQFFSFFCAAVLPTGIAWTAYHIELTGFVMMLQMFAVSLGGICYMSMIGYLYDHFGPKSFLLQILCYGVLEFILAVGMDCVGAIHGNRLDDKKLRKNEDISTEVHISTIKTDKV